MLAVMVMRPWLTIAMTRYSEDDSVVGDDDSDDDDDVKC